MRSAGGDGTDAVPQPVIEEGSARVRASGELDTETIDQFDDLLAAALSTSPTTLIVDVGELEFLGSVAVTSLLRARSQVERLVLRRCAPRVRRPLKVAGLERFFEFDP